MKTLTFFFLGFILLTFACNPTENKAEIELEESSNQQEATTAKTETGYDSLLAKRLGGDEWGMKKYVLALLKTGPNRPTDKEEIQKLQAGHMANIQRLAEEGKLVVAGPFWGEKDSDLRGVFIFNVETLEEAEALTNSDPAVQAGSLIMELHPWYCSAALVEVNAIHKKITKPAENNK